MTLSTRRSTARGNPQGAKSSMSKLTSSGSPEARAAASGSAAAEATRDQLYLRAAELGINGRSRMTKQALIDAIAVEERARPRR